MGIETLLSNGQHYSPNSVSLAYQTPYCVPVPVDVKIKGETPPFRNTRVLQGLHYTPEYGINTVIDIIQTASAKFGSCAAIGSRVKIRTHTRQGPPESDGNRKQLSVPELSEYKFMSYRDYEALITDIGSGLLKAGLHPRQDKICIWAQTR